MTTTVRRETLSPEMVKESFPGAVTVTKVTVTRSTATTPRTFIVTTAPLDAEPTMGTVTKTVTRKVTSPGTSNTETVETVVTTSPVPAGEATRAQDAEECVAKTALGTGQPENTEALVTTRTMVTTVQKATTRTTADGAECGTRTIRASSDSPGSPTTSRSPGVTKTTTWTSETSKSSSGVVTKVTSTVTAETTSSEMSKTPPGASVGAADGGPLKQAPEGVVKPEARTTTGDTPRGAVPFGSAGAKLGTASSNPGDARGDLSKMEFFSFLFRKQRVRGRSRPPSTPPRPSGSPVSSGPSGPSAPPAPAVPTAIGPPSRPTDPEYVERVVVANELEATPTSREVIDHRSKTVEQILEILKKGTQLWKVRSFTKWYRRTYYLDDKEGTVRYEPSHKAPCVHSPLKIIVDDIIDVRKGWKTDTFNKIEKKVERRRLKFPSQPSPVDERCCFSIIYSSNKQSLDLVAPEPKIADMWVRGLRHIVTVLKGLHQEERFDRWLEQQFHEADVDNNNGLNFEESLKLLKQLNVKMPRTSVKKIFDEANTVKHTRNGEQVLDADEFVSFYMKLMTRNDIKDIYARYTKNNKEMTVADLLDFIHKEQKGHTTTKEECLTLIEAFEQSNLKLEGKLSLIGFTNMLMSEQFDAFKQYHKVVYQDMHQPLSHYYIATSHNTYLTGKQLHGESSVEGYIDALKQGCRCVEMDCWDGPDGEPIIYHGYTLTTKILFRDVLVDAIKPYSFHSSEYPVILSLENHLSPKQQEVLTKHLIEVLGDMLYTVPVNETWEYLPSPEELKRKIIIKAKKKAASSNADDDSSTDDEAEPPPGADQNSRDLKGKREVTHALSNLVNICEAVHFHSFEDTEANKKCYQMSSFSEAKANKFIETKGPEFVKYNTKHLSRIYPAGTRTDSSNFKPIPYWNVGCQLVALNYQHAAKPMLYNDAKFDDNGGCGYVLKPEVLRRNAPYDPESTENDKNQVTLKLTVISGQHIPKADNDAEGEIVDPYVKVKIVGHPKDNQKFQTEAVRNNGFNPRWDCEMIFNIKMPEFAIIHFIVKDLSTTGKDVTLGTYAIPFNSLQEGYSHVYLKDYERNFVSPASIFIHAVTI